MDDVWKDPPARVYITIRHNDISTLMKYAHIAQQAFDMVRYDGLDVIGVSFMPPRSRRVRVAEIYVSGPKDARRDGLAVMISNLLRLRGIGHHLTMGRGATPGKMVVPSTAGDDDEVHIFVRENVPQR